MAMSFGPASDEDEVIGFGGRLVLGASQSMNNGTEPVEPAWFSVGMGADIGLNVAEAARVYGGASASLALGSGSSIGLYLGFGLYAGMVLRLGDAIGIDLGYRGEDVLGLGSASLLQAAFLLRL